jgi:hypothetical protein
MRGYRRFKKMLYSLRVFGRDEVAQQRMKIIKFYEQYGEEATKEAFGADRKVISRWRKRLKGSGGDLASNEPPPSLVYTGCDGQPLPFLCLFLTPSLLPLPW